MESERQWRIRRPTSSGHQPQQSDAVTDSNDAEDAVDRQSGPKRRLGVLLEDHVDLLIRVLSCVMDDGLHECRRVCRRWRDTCGKLPVRLGDSYLDKLDRVADLFPKAVSLSVTRSFDRADVVGRQAMENLSRLKNLQDLSLSMRSNQADINGLVTLLPSSDCLRSLSVSTDQEDGTNDILQVLRLLTNLEALTLIISPNVTAETAGILRFIPRDLHPVTELRRLRYPNTYLLALANSRGELLFPSLTRLTHLRLRFFNGPWASFSWQVCELRKRISYPQT